MPRSDILEDSYNNAVSPIPRTKLTSDLNLYVNAALGTDLSGAGLGTGAAAYATIKFAIDNAASLYDLNGNRVIINLADDTYTISSEIILPEFIGGYDGNYQVEIAGSNFLYLLIEL